MKSNDLKINEKLNLAIESHKNKQFQLAEKLYKEILPIHPKGDDSSGIYFNFDGLNNKLKVVIRETSPSVVKVVASLVSWPSSKIVKIKSTTSMHRKQQRLKHLLNCLVHLKFSSLRDFCT